MRSRNLIILTLAVVALGAFIFFVERHQPTTEERVKRAHRVFPDLDGDAVVEVEIDRAGGPVRLLRTDQAWRLTEPVDSPAEASTVNALVGAIAALDVERTLSLDEIDLSDYGLDDPAFGVVLVDADGRRFSLAVGDPTPLGSNRAVRRGLDDVIVMTSGAFVAGLDREIDDWRSRDVVDLLEQNLASVEIVTAEDHIRAERKNGRWQLEQPLVDLADRSQMQSLVSELNTLRVSEFLPADADPAELGLDPPAFRVFLEPSDGSADLTLDLAAATDDAATVACRRNGVDLFRVSAVIETRLAKAPVLWRSKEVWPFSSWDVATAEFAKDDEKVVVREDGGLWELDDGSAADSAEVRRRLDALADLVVREHDLMLPPTGVLGSVVLVLDNDEGAEGLTYTFYAPMEEGGSAAVTVSTRGDVMGIDAVSAETILDDLDKLGAPVEEPPTED
jgi:hypothetical protein